MKRGELAVKLERWEPLAPCAACFLLTAVLCGAQLFGGYAPFALGLVAAAGSGKRGLAALLGGVAGALVFLDFSHALRTLRSRCCSTRRTTPSAKRGGIARGASCRR